MTEFHNKEETRSRDGFKWKRNETTFNSSSGGREPSSQPHLCLRLSLLPSHPHLLLRLPLTGPKHVTAEHRQVLTVTPRGVGSSSVRVCPHVPIKVFSALVLCNDADGTVLFVRGRNSLRGKMASYNSCPGREDATQTLLDEQGG